MLHFISRNTFWGFILVKNINKYRVICIEKIISTKYYLFPSYVSVQYKLLIREQNLCDIGCFLNNPQLSNMSDSVFMQIFNFLIICIYWKVNLMTMYRNKKVSNGLTSLRKRLPLKWDFAFPRAETNCW